MRRVAACTDPRKMVSQNSNGYDGNGQALDDIMHFRPLRDAFVEFCRKALCSEVRNGRVRST